MKKTLRSVILLVLALSMLLALTACSTSQKSDKVKIGVTLMDFSTEFGIGLKDYMTAKADAMDYAAEGLFHRSRKPAAPPSTRPRPPVSPSSTATP